MFITRRRRLLFGSNRPITYILRDQFLTDVAAPLPSPRVAEPGPGNFTVTTGAAELSIVNGRLRCTANPANYQETNVRALVCGLCLAVTHYRDLGLSSDPRIHWNGAVSTIRANGSALRGPNDVQIGGISGTLIQYFSILRNAGAFLAYRLGTTVGPAKLMFVNNVVQPNVKATLGFTAAGSGTECDDLKAIQLTGPFTTDYGIVHDRKATVLAADIINHQSNGFIEFTFTAATGVTVNIMVRRVDDDNCIIIRCDQAAGTIRVYEKVAGVETERTGGTTTNTWTNGAVFRVCVLLESTTIRTFVQPAATGVVAAKNIATSSAHLIATTAKVDANGTEFDSWPEYINLPNGL